MLCYDGTRLTVGAADRPSSTRIAAGTGSAQVHRALRELTDENLAPSGTRLRALRPAGLRLRAGRAAARARPPLARALVGTEGTCVTVLGATVRLVDGAGAPACCWCSASRDDSAAADAVAGDPAAPAADRGGHRHRARAAAPGPRRQLPDGDAWLFVELGGETVDAEVRRTRLAKALDASRPPAAHTHRHRARRATRALADPRGGCRHRDPDAGRRRGLARLGGRAPSRPSGSVPTCASSAS